MTLLVLLISSVLCFTAAQISDPDGRTWKIRIGLLVAYAAGIIAGAYVW